MRLTVTLDDDVAAALERRRATRGTQLREDVNDLLRVGLAADTDEAADYQLPTHDSGRRFISDSRELGDLLDDEDVARAPAEPR